MAEIRKTRQQKIAASQRRAEQLAAVASTDTLDVTQLSEMSADQRHHLANISEHAYVSHDLKRIGVIMIVCLALLLIATILLSDLAWLVDLRQAWHIPTLTIR